MRTAFGEPFVGGSRRVTLVDGEVAERRFVVYVPPTISNPCSLDTSWLPNTGDILLPAIAAVALTSPFTITPGAIAVAIPVLVISPVRFPVIEAAVPLTLPVTLPVRFPVTLPIRLEDIIFAEKLPLASRLTRVLEVLLFVAAWVSLTDDAMAAASLPPTVATVVAIPRLVTSPVRLPVKEAAVPLTFPVTLPVRLPVTFPVRLAVTPEVTESGPLIVNAVRG
jgi:hypothetical protein